MAKFKNTYSLWCLLGFGSCGWFRSLGSCWLAISSLSVGIDRVKVSSDIDLVSLSCKVLLDYAGLWSSDVDGDFVSFDPGNNLVSLDVFSRS